VKLAPASLDIFAAARANCSFTKAIGLRELRRPFAKEMD
jgi:hypothetical protein